MADALVRQIAVRVLDPVLDMDWSQLEFKIMREGTVRLKDVNLKKDFVRKIIPEGAPMHIEDVSVRSGELDVKWTLGKAITAFLGSHTDIPATLTLYGVTIDLVIDLDAEAAAAAAAATVADAAAKGGSAATGDPTGDAEATEDDGWSPGPDEGQEGSGGRGAGSRAVAVMSALGGGRFAEAGKITVDGEADDEAVASLPRDPQLWRTLEAAQQEARQVQEARMTRYDKQPASAASATQRLTATAMRILEQSAVVVLRDLRINVRYVSGAAAAPFEAALSVDSVVLDASQPPPAFTEAVKGLERRARHFWTRTLSVTGLAVSLTPLQAADSMAATASLVGAMSRRAKVARLRAAKAAALRLNSAKVGRERAAAAGGGAGAVKWGPGTGVIPGGAGGESGLAGELWAAGEGEDEIGAPVVDGESTDDDDDDDDDSDRGGDGANAAAAHAGGARVRGTRRRGLGHRRGEDETGSGRGGGDMDEEAEARSPLASRARADRRTLTPRRSSSSADTGELREEDLLVPAPAPAGHDEADAWDILRKTTLRVSATRQVGPIDSAAHPAEVSAEAHIGVLEMRLHERQAECLVAFADDVKAWKAKATSGGDDNGSGSSSGRDAAVARPSQIRASGSGAEGDTAEGASQGGSAGHGPSGKRRQAVPDPQGPASLRGLSASADTVLMAEYSALARRFFWRPSVARCVPKVARVDAILRRLESVVVPPFTPEPFVVVTAKPLSPLEAGSLLRRSSWAASRAISGVTTAPQPRSVPQAGRRPAAALPVPPSRSVYRLALVKLVRPSPRPACFLDKTEEADPDNWGSADSDGDLDFEGADDGTLGDSSDYGDGSREHNGEGDGDEDGELVGGPDDDDGGEQLRGHSRGRHRRAGGGRGAASGRGGRRAEAEARLADRQAAAMHSLRRMHRLEQALAARGGKASIVACRTIAEEELRAEFRARYQRQIMQAALASSRGLVCGGDAQRHEEYSVSLSASLSAEADASAAMARLMREQSSALGPEARTGAQTKASGPAGMVALPLVSWCALRGDFLQAMSASGARGGGAASAAAADAIVNRALMRASADDLAGVVFACPQLMLSAGDAAVPGRGGIPGARVAASAAAAAATVAMSAASSGWARLATGKTPPPSAAASPIASGRSGHSDDESGAASAAPSSDGSAGEEAQPHDSGPVEPPQPRSFRWLRDTAKFRWRALRRFQRATTAGRLEAVRSLRQELEVDLAPVVAAVRVAQCAVADSPALARALALPAQRLGSADRASLPSRRSRAAGSTARSRPTDSSAADRGWKMPQQWPVLGAAVRGRIDGGAPAAASAGAAASVGPWAGGVLARQGGVPWLAEAGTDDSSFVLPRAAAAALYASRFRSLAARGHSDLPDGYQRYAFQLSVSHAGAEIVSRAGTPLARLAVDSVSLGASDRKDACRDFYLAVGRVNVTADPGIDAEASSGLGRSLVRALSAVAVMRPRAIQAPRLSAEHCGGGEPRDEPEHGSARRSSGLSATRSTAGSLAGSEAGRRVAQDNRLSPTSWGGGGRQAPPQAGSRLLEGAVGGKGSTLPTVARGVRVWAGTTTAAELAASAARAIFGCGTAAWVQSLADPGLALAGDSWSSLDREVGRALRMAGLSHTRGGFRDHARWVAIARELDAAEELTVPGSEARETAAHARRLDLPLHHLALAGDGPPTPPGSRSDSNGRTRGGGHGRRGRAKQAEDATPSSASEVLPAGARSAWRVLQHATAKFFESVPSLRAMLLDEDICAAMVAFARARAEALLADPEVEAKDCEGPLGLHPLTADGGRWAGLVDAGSELRVDLIKPAAGNAQAVSSLGSGRGALGAAAGDGDGRFVPSPGFAGGAAAAASAGGGGGGSRRLAALKVVEAAVYPRSRALDGGFRTPSLAAPELQASRFVESVTNRMDEPRRGCLRGPGSFGGLPSVPSVRRREAVLNISSPVSQSPIPGPDSRLAGASAARWNRWLLASVGAELVLLARHLETCLSNTDPADLIAVAQTMLRSRFLRRSAAAGAMVPSRFYIHIEALVPHTRPPQPDAAGAVAALPAPGALHSRPGSSTTAVAWTLSRLRSGLAFLAAGSDDEMDVDGRRASAAAGVAATSEGGAPAMAGGTARESGVRELRQLLELLAAFTMELIDIAVAAPFLDSQWCPFARAFAWRAAAVDRPLTPSLPRVEVLRALQGRFAFLDRKRRELLARVAFGVQEALMAAASRAPGHGGRGGARAAARPQSPGALGSPGEPAPHGSASQATAAAAAAASFGQGKGRAGSEAGAADSSPPSKSAAHSAADGSRETFLDDADRVMVAADATRAAKLLRSRSVSSRQWDVGTGAAATSRLWSAGYLGTLGLRSRGSLLDGTSLHPLMEQAVEDGAGVMHPAESLLLGRASEPGSLPVYTMRHVLLVRASTSGQAGGVLDEGDPDDVMVGAVLPRLMAAETVALAGLPAAMAATAANSGHVESASADRLHQAAVDAIHAVADGDVPWTYRALRSAAIDAAGCAAKESVTVADLDEQLGRVAEAAVAQASATTDMESAGWAARSQHWQEGQEAASSAKDRLRELPRQLSALPEGGTCLAQGKFRMAILHEAADDEASLAGGLLGRVADWVPVHVEVDSSGKWLRCYRSRSTTRAEATAKAPISAGVMVLSGEALAARGGRPAKNPAATGFGGLWGSAPAVSSEVVANNGMCIMDPPAMSDGAMRALLLVADTVEERERWCGLLRACVQADEAERAMTEDSLLREVAAQRIARETDSGPPGHGAEGGGGSGDTHGILATLSRLGGAPPTLRPGYGAELARRDWQLSAGDWRRTRQAVVRVRLAPTAVTLCPGLFASALAFARRIHIERLVRPASDASDPGNASSGSVGDESGAGKLASVAMLVSRTKASTKRHRGAGSRPDVANLSSLFGADASGEEGSKRGDEIAPERGAGHAVRAGSHAQLLQGPLGTIAEEEADAPERRSGSLRRPGRPERRQPDWLGLSAGDGGALSDGSSVDSDSEDDDALVLDAADSQPGSTKKGQAAAAKASGKGHLVLSLVMDRFQFAVGAVENTAAEQRAAKRDAQGGVPSSGPAEDLDDPASLPRRAKEAGPRFTGVRLVVSSIALVTSTSSKGVRGRVNTKGRAAWDGHGLSQVVEAVGRSAPHSALAAALSAAQGFPPGSAAVEAEASVPPWQPPSQGAFRSAAAERPPGAPDDGELIDGIRVSAGGARRPDHVGTGKQSGDASAALASWAVGGTQAASKPLAVPSFCLRIGSVRAQALAASGDDRPGAANASAETDHAFRELFRASAHRLAVLAVQLPASVGLARRSDGGTALIALPPAVPGALPRKGDRALLASVGQLQAWEPARWVESRYAAVWPRLSAPEHAVSRGRCIFVGDVSRSGEDWDGGGDAEVEPPASSGRPGKQQAGLGRFASFSQGLTPAGGGQWPTGAHQLRASVAPKLRAWKSKAAAEVRLRGIRPLLAVSLVDASAPARPRPTRKRRFQLVAPPSPAEGDLGTGAASARRAADEVQRLVRSGLGSGEATGQAGKADARWPERVMRVHVSMGKLCLTPDLTTAAFAMQWAARAQAIASRLAPAAGAGAGVPEPKPGPAPAGSSLLVATVSLHAGVSVRLSAYNSPILHVSLLPARVRASVFTPATLRRDASVAGSRSTQLAADVNGISVVLCRSTDWFVRPIARAEAAHPSAASMRAAAPDPADADPWARLSPAQALARRVWLRRRLLRPAVSDLCAAGVHAAAPDRRLTDALFWSAGLVYDGVQDLEAVQHARDKSREAFEAAVEIAAAVQRDPFLCPAAVQAASAQAMPAVWSGVEGGVVRLAVERMRLELRQTAPPTEAAGELARDSMGGASASHDVESGTGLASDADDRSEDSSDQRPSPAGSPAEGAGSSAGDAKDGEATPEGPPARHRGTGRSDSSGGRASMEVSVALERLTLLVEPDPRGVPPGARRCLYHSDPGPEEERGAHHRSATSAADTWRRASAAALAAERQDSATGSPLRPGGGTGRRRGQHRPGAPSGSSVSGGGRRRRDGGVSSRRARASDSSTKRRRQGSSGATSGPQLASLPHEAAAGLHAAYRRWPLPPWRWVYGRASRDHTPRTMLRVGPLVPAGYAAAKKEEPLSGRGAHAASQRARRPPRRTAKDPAASGGWSSIVLARRRAMASTAPPFDRLPPEPATKWEAQPEEWGMCVGLVQAPSESWPASGDGYGLVAEVSAGDMDLTADPLCLMQLNQTVMLFRECLRCCEREAHPKAARRPFFATLVDERSSESPWSARSGFQGHRGMAPGAANRAGLATASFDAQAPTRRARQPPELPPDFDSEAVSRMLWASKAGDQRGGRYISVRVARAQVILCALADGARRVWTAVDLEAARRGPGPAALAGVGDVGMAGPGTGDDDMPPSGAAQFAGLRWLFAHPCTRGAVVDLMHAAAQRMEVEVTNLELPRLGSQQTTHLRMGPLLAVDTSPSPATVLTPRPEDDATCAVGMAAKAREELLRRRSEQLDARATQALADAEADARTEERLAFARLVGSGTSTTPPTGEPARRTSATPVSDSDAPGADGAASVASSQPHPAADAATVLSTDDLLADSDAQAATGGASPTLSSDPAGSAAPRASAEVLGAAKPSPLQPAPRLAEQAGVLGRLSVSFSVSQRDAAIVWTELAMPRLPTRMAALSALLRKDRSRGGEKSIAREDVLFALDTALPPRPPAKRPAGEGRAGAGASAGAAHASPLPSAPTARDARFSATAFAAFSRRPGTDGVLLSLRDHVAATHEAEAASALPGHLRRAPAPSRSPMVLQDPSLSLDLPLSWCALDVYDARHDVSAPADPSLVLSGLLAAVARRAQLGSGVASDGSQGPPAPFGMHPEGIPPGLDGEATLSGAAGGAAAVGQPDGSAASLATPTTRAAATPSPSQHQGVRASSTVADASSVPGQGRASQGGAFGSADEGDGSSVERSLQQSSQVDEALARVAEAHAALEQQQALERRVLAVRAAGLPLWDDEVSEAQGALGMFADEEDEHAMRNLEAGAGASSLSSVVGLGSSGTMREMGVEGETLGLGIDPHARVDRGGFRASQPRTGVLGDAGARREASGAAVADEGNLRAREADVERREAAMDKAAQIVSSMAGESWMTLRRLETPIGLAAEAAGEDAGLGQSRGVDMVGAPQWARRRVARLGRAQLPPRGPGCDQQVVDRRRTIQIQLYMRDTRICYVPRFVNEVLAIQLATMEAAYGRTVWRLGDLPPPPMIGFSHVVMEARRLEVLVPPGSRADDPVLRTRMGSMSMEMSLESHSFEAAAASAAGSAIQSGRSLRRSRPTKAIDMQVLNVRSMTDVVVDQPPADELPLVPSTARGRAAESVSDHGFVMAIPWVSVSVTEPFGQLNKLACPLQRLMQVQISPASVTMTSAVPVLVNVQQSVMGAMRELSPTIRNASRPFAEHANLTMSSQQLGSGSGGGAASGGAGSTADSPGSVMQVTLREQVQPDRLPELREQPFPDDPFVLLSHRFFPDFACLAPAGLFSTRVPEGSAASAGEELCRRAQAHRLHRLAQRGAGEPDSPIPLFLSPDALATAASDAEAGGMAGHAALLGMSLSVLLGTPMERPPDQPDDDQLGLGSEWTASPARSAPGAPWVAESPPRSPHSQGRFALATSPAGGLGELAADPAGFLSRESALTSRSMLDSGADGSAQDQLAAITDELCQVGLQGAEVSALQGLASREGEAPGHLPSELAVSSTQASVLEAAAAALRRAMESSDAAGGASKALEAVARVAQLLEAAQGPARRTELAAEEQAAMLADQNAFLLGQLLGEQPAAPDE
ncbi:hypothetical protein FNF27_03793 [Cafeteria roenbergensis]|uniref:Uncharacterized protein n=4 Tax=Cafeteria roenbergensis TaxID=33653 RepID=A0A5A8EFD6_CAFRO|nr:hypothetical protein FNF27_03793 [Cafeteria roenbergensis]